MTLEDFFTLTEMKDGLSALDRTNELVNMIEEEKNSTVKNVGDAVRQWSTVASIIAVTENKDCLDLFVQMDGLNYLDSWLKDAHKFGKETGDSFVEESITALLGAVEKLHTNSQKSVNSGIFLTVKNLLGYSSSKVQDKARILFDSWKQNNDSVLAPQDASVLETGCENQTNATASTSADEHPECFSHDISHSGGSHNEGKCVDARDDTESTYSGSNNQKVVDGINIQTSDRTLDRATMNDQPADPTFSDMLKPVGDTSSVQENTTTYGSEVTTGSNDFALIKQATQEGQLDNSSNSDDAEQMQQTKDCDKSDATDTSLSAGHKNGLESKLQIDMDNNVDAIEENHFMKVSSSGNVEIDVSGENGVMGDTVSVNPCRRTLESEPTNQISENAGVLQKNMDRKLEFFDDLATYSSRIGDTEVIKESIEQHSGQPEDDLELSRSALGSKDSDDTDKTSGIKHDYSTIVPPEVAQQVTIEVKRQIDCRDTSCSSSERTSCGGISLSRSLDSINGENSKVINVLSGDIPNEPNSNADSVNGAFITAENQITGQESQTSDMAVAHVGSPALGTELNKDEHICGFDLNEEKLSDDMEHSINPLAAPLSVVSGSTAAPTSGISDTPVQFEGTLGWKGSAETSAFLSAPLRRIFEREKPPVTSGKHDISEERQNYLDFDLNVADALEDDKTTDLILGKEIPNSSDQPYGYSHVKVSPRKSDLLQLDLNRVSYDDDAPAHLRAEGKHLQHRSGHRSPSASSSSSMQPTLRNIDLNDQPSSIFNDFSDPNFIGKSSPILSGTGGFKPDDSVISMTGAEVEINRKNLVPQISPFLNGRILDYAVDTSSSRSVSALGMGPTLPYAPSPVYGYNVPPSVPAMPFSSAMYGLNGHVPCMVDSKGSPVVPQILGSPSAIPTAYPQMPFMMSMAATPTGSSEVRPLDNGFDLNMGMLVDGGNRDTGGLKHLFNSGQGRELDDHLRANPHTSSSSVGGKRKETDGGLELFPLNYKHHQSPWK